MIKHSKFLSLILRHQPEKGGITLAPEGWAEVVEVLRAVNEKVGPMTREELQELVDTNDKKRFAFDDSGTRIRANQGHSAQGIDLGLQPVEPPALLYHGTKVSFLNAISREGLKPGSRHHVHLSSDIETARRVAGRRSGESVILIVRSEELGALGHSFYRSDNDVWLTDAVPPAYFDVFIEHGDRS
jgi:putative RNA 2'-phosphotransferase